MTTRRDLLQLAAALPALAFTEAVRAQVRKPFLIGWFESGSRDSGLHLLAAFKDGMAEHGWKERTQYTVEERWLAGRMDRLQELARELAAGKPHLIVAQPSSVVAAAAAAMPDIPIVQMGGSPLESGIIASLSRPGGMITGLSAVSSSLIEKLVEILHEAMPGARRVGFLMDPKARSLASTLEHARTAITRYAIDARFTEAIAPEQLEPAISRLARDGAQAIIVLPNVWYSGARHSIVKYALAHRLPVAAGGNQYPEAGGLIGYGADAAELRRRAAYFVDRILKGAKPGDLPIEQPTKFELVINTGTAKALGIAIPQSILVRADRVIE
jgi:putative ABC transport system substrate-binding protein